MKSKILSFLVVSMLVAQCTKQSEKTVFVTNEVRVPTEATRVEALVLADAGASLSIGDKVQLIVPAGALNEDTQISVTKTGVAAPRENLIPLTTSLEMGAHGVEFDKPVSLNVCYDPAALSAENVKEETVQVYYVDPLTGEYAAVGGTVNKSSHCVMAQLSHFSTYLVAAQILQGGNNAPVISAPTFTPSVPLAGLPLKVSSVITDYELSTVNGQIGFGQVATASLYYRIPGEPSFTQVALTPDYLDDTATRYSYKIPANRVTAAGIEYYLKSTDNLGLYRIRNTTTLTIARTATSITFQTNAVVDLAAGFKRSYTVRAIDDLGSARNIDVDSFVLNGGIGTAAKTAASVIQISATTANPQNYRIGSLTANAGAFTVTSQDIRVHAGFLDHIALLSPTGIVLGNSITVNANATYDFDVLGYDAFGNTSNVMPQFVIVPVSGAGTITPTGLYTAPATAQTATLVATLDGVMDSILINVVPPPPVVTILGDGSAIFGEGVAVDSIGNVFITERAYHRVLKVSPIGIVSVFAGQFGVQGGTDGPGNVATFSYPMAIDIDALGNLYIPEFGNHRVRKVDPLGNVTTIAGGGAGDLDGACLSALFIAPAGIAVGPGNSLYITDRYRIKKIDLAGCTVTTVAGDGLPGAVDGPALTARFRYLSGVHLDAGGNVYVSDLGGHQVRKLDIAAGTVSTIAGTGSAGYLDGSALLAEFNQPNDIAINSVGDIIVADGNNPYLRKITGFATVSTLSDLPPSAPFNLSSAAIAFDGAGALYAVGNGRLLKIQ